MDDRRSDVSKKESARGSRSGRRRLRHVAAAAIVLALAIGALAGRLRPDRTWPAGNRDLVIVHITDTHLSSDPNGPVATPWIHKIIIDGYKLHRKCLGKSVALFEEAVRLVNEKVHPDLVVITGDIVDRANDVKAWKEADRIIREIESPVLVVQGDHDAPAGAKMFEKYCGPLYRETVIGETPFFVLPFNADEATLRRFGRDFAGTPSRTGLKVLCIHRMLKASWLMRKLSKAFYCPTLLSPHRAWLLKMLHGSKDKVLVLCGHSHTNYVSRDGNILHVCTSALVEYPHEIRVLYVTGNRVRDRVLRLSRLRKMKPRPRKRRKGREW